MAATQPAGTVTMVFTDIEGSTTLLEQLGTLAYRDALEEHRRIIRDACARHGGYEVNCEGTPSSSRSRPPRRPSRPSRRR